MILENVWEHCFHTFILAIHFVHLPRMTQKIIGIFSHHLLTKVIEMGQATPRRINSLQN